MGLGGRPTSTDGFILGPSHGTVGRLAFFHWAERRSPGTRIPGLVRNFAVPHLLNLSL